MRNKILLLAAVVALVLALVNLFSNTREQETFAGTVQEGQSFKHLFGGRFTFTLWPYGGGWLIEVQERGRNNDLAKLTPPLHGPNATDIEGWQFGNKRNPGLIEGDNCPQYERQFIFSPEIGRSILSPPHKFPRSREMRQILSHLRNFEAPVVTDRLTSEDFDRIERFGHGTLIIDRLELSPSAPDGTATIKQMSFHCNISWLRQ
jgi:hypothetical protein